MNYERAALDQNKSGHISPLAAYDEQTDKLLILDVAAYKYRRYGSLPPTSGTR